MLIYLVSGDRIYLLRLEVSYKCGQSLITSGSNYPSWRPILATMVVMVTSPNRVFQSFTFG